MEHGRAVCSVGYTRIYPRKRRVRHNEGSHNCLVQGVVVRPSSVLAHRRGPPTRMRSARTHYSHSGSQVQCSGRPGMLRISSAQMPGRTGINSSAERPARNPIGERTSIQRVVPNRLKGIVDLYPNDFGLPDTVDFAISIRLAYNYGATFKRPLRNRVRPQSSVADPTSKF